MSTPIDWSLFHRTNPYDGFPIKKYDLKVQGWNYEHDTFDRLITEIRPRLIFEVGTWLGGSALRMAGLARDAGLDTRVICVDTWLGSQEFWDYQTDPGRYESLECRNGYPQVYCQFLANVIKSGYTDSIIPLPITSLIGARLLANRGLQADLIYIDASHDYEDVLADLKAYYPLVRSGGVMFGDDFVECWPGVIQAVNEFFDGIGAKAETDGGFWVFRKP